MREEKEIWPNFFIVGAPKAGTTSMYEYMRQIPDVFMSKVKEPCYFLSPAVQNLPRIRGRVIKQKEQYLKLFERATSHKVIGEASPFYLWDAQSPQRIQKVVPGAKILILLRNPVQRAFSYYKMMLREGYESQSFFDALRRDDFYNDRSYNDKTYLYIEAGLYSSQVSRYIETFGRENVMTLFYEELIRDIIGSVRNVLDFLELPLQIPEDFDQAAYNSHAFSIARPLTGLVINVISSNRVLFKITQLVPASMRSLLMDKVLTKKTIKLHIDKESEEFLRDIYFEDIHKLESLLGRKAPWDICRSHSVS